MSDSKQEDAASETMFVRRRGKVEGPWTRNKLKSEMKLRKLSRFHEVSIDKKSWVRAESLDWLFVKAKVRQKTKQPDVEVPINRDKADSNISTAAESISVAAGHDDGKWFIGINGKEIGPIAKAEVQRKIISGEAGKRDLVWHDGYADWLPLAHVPEFVSLLNQAQSIVAETATNVDVNASPQSMSQFESRHADISLMATWSLIVGLFSFPGLTIISLLMGLISMRYFVIGIWLGVPLGAFGGILGLLALQKFSQSGNKQSGKSRAAIGLITGASAALSCLSIVSYGLFYGLFNY